MFKLFFATLALSSVALWAFILGSVAPTVVQADTLAPVYRDYLTFTMHEDGSYTAKTIQGDKVTGCIDSALCKD